MGNELVTDSSPRYGSESINDYAPLSPIKFFNDQLPFYLAIGMTYDQFFNEDCCLVKYYRKAYELKLREKNYELWFQGLYFYDALCKASPLLKSFVKEGTKPLPYPDEPYPLTLDDIKKREEDKEKARYEQQKTIMSSWAEKTNAHFEEKVGEVNGR